MSAFRNTTTGEIVIGDRRPMPHADWQPIAAPPAADGWRWNEQAGAWQPQPPSLMPAQFWQLLTIAEHAALAVAARADDGLISVAFDRINAARDPLPLDDALVAAMIWRGVALGILSEQRAAQVLAGHKPA